jgi:ABC-type sugar transport system substrate-binding protein
MEAATALRESGIGPGEKVVICADISVDILAGIKEGYITGTVGQQFAQEGFWGLIGMHLQHTNPVPITADDEATGFMGGPYRLIMPNPWIDKSNVAAWETINEME